MPASTAPPGALRAWRALLDASGLFAGFLVALICVGVCLDVGMRWLGLGGISWMLETIEYLQYVMVLAGAAWVLATGSHVAIDAVIMAMRPHVRRSMERGASAFGALVSGVFSAACIAATIDTYKTGSVLHKSITLPEWLQVAVLSVGFVTLTVEFVLQAAGLFEEREKLDL